MELPKGSTAVDFAYAVHTDVGNTCIACRINRRLAPLSEPLQSGETVEIVTAPARGPTRPGSTSWSPARPAPTSATPSSCNAAPSPSASANAC